MENQPNTPTIVPEASVSGAYGHGWETLRKFIPELLVVFLIEVCMSLPAGLGQFLFPATFSGVMFSSLFNVIYGLIVLVPVTYGIRWVYLKAVRNDAFKPTDLFFAFQQIGNVILAALLTGLIIGFGFVLLIVPGIIFACKLAFVPYLVMDEKLDATEAIRQSWKMTHGHAGTIFLMGLLAFFVGLLGLICLIIGIIPAVIWIRLSFASLYHSVSDQMKNQPLTV